MHSRVLWCLVFCAGLGLAVPQIGLAQTKSLNELRKEVDELYRNGKYAAAVAAAKRYANRAQVLHGTEHFEYATAILWLADAYNADGRYSEAEPLARRALKITQGVKGPDHLDVGGIANSLAQILENLDKRDEAESLYKRALAIAESKTRKDDPIVATALNNLAWLYTGQRRFAAAEPLFQRSLRINVKAFGPNDRNVGLSSNNLAVLYRLQNRLALAEPLLKRSVKIAEATRGREHRHVADSLINLAGVLRDLGRYSEAKLHYERSLHIYRKKLGPDHPAVGNALVQRGYLYRLQEQYDEAEKDYSRSLAIRLNAFGPNHPAVGLTLINLGELYFAQTDWQRALDYLRRATDVIVRRSRLNRQVIGKSLVGSKLSATVRSSLGFQLLLKSAMRLMQRGAKQSAQLAAEAFQLAQWVVDSEAAASLAKMAARQAAVDADVASLVHERQNLIGRWQRLDALRNAMVSKSLDQRNRRQELEMTSQLGQVEGRIATIDDRLKVEFPDYSAIANPEPLTVADVQRYLKKTEALVFFLGAVNWTPTTEETFIWVVTKTESRWVRSDLGPKALSAHVDGLRCGLDELGAWNGSRCSDLLGVQHYRGSGRQLPFRLDRAYALYKSLFGKIEDLTEGKDLLVVPSGPLTKLPFQVLVTEKPEKDEVARDAFARASWLAKRHAITVLPSVTSLKALRDHAKASKATDPFIGFGNPLLVGPNGTDRRAWTKQTCPADGALPKRTLATHSLFKLVASFFRGDLANVELIRHQHPLPETADEVCAVAKASGVALPNEAVFLGNMLKESTIKTLSDRGRLANAKVIHFATHGLIVDETERIARNQAEPALMMTPPEKASAYDDGLLTASEVTTLKLDADWVILSACNTAAGGAKSAEALSGLAKAFFYAGARSLLVSHWYVDSQATVSLITKVFDALKRRPKLGRAAALQQAMLLLINDKRTWHPAYWAPFVVVGEGAG